MNLSIRTRIALLFAIIVIPSIAIMGRQFDDHRRELIAERKQALLVFAERTAAELGESVAEGHLFLQSIALMPFVARKDPAECARVLAHLGKLASRFTTIFITDPMGAAWCGSHQSAMGADFADRDYFLRARESGKPSVGLPIVGRVSRKPTLPLAVPLHDSAGAFSGALTLGVDLHWIEQQRARNAATESMRISIWSADGTIHYRTPAGESSIGRRFPDAGVVRWLAVPPNQSATVEATGIDGTEKLYAIASLEQVLGRPVVLSIGVSRASVTSPVDRAIVRTAFVLAAVVLAALAIAFIWAERSLSRPIASLVGFSRRLASGDLSARAPAKQRSGELGNLAESLEDMRGSLDHYRNHLQELVAQRTLELQSEREKALTAFESMQDACAILVPVRDGAGAVADFRYEYVNGVANRWSQRGHDGLLGGSMLEAFPARRGSELFRAYARVIDTGEPLSLFSVACPGNPAAAGRAPLYDVQATRIGDRCMVIWRDVTEQQRSAREHELILRTAIDGFWIVGSGGRLQEVNEAYCSMSGYSRAELLAMTIADLEAAEGGDEVRAHIERVRATGSDRFQTRHRRKDGAVIDVEISVQVSSVRNDALVVFVKDITATKRMERELLDFNERLKTEVDDRTAELRNTNRILRTLSAINGTVVRAKTHADLLNEVCRILVEVGQYRTAWVGFAETDAAKTIRRAAAHGERLDYLDTFPHSWAEGSGGGCGCIGGTIRSGLPTYVNNTEADGLPGHRCRAAEYGFLSLASLPLRDGAQVVGALTLYSGEAWSFNASEIALLEELAGDVGFGVATLNNEVRRAEAEWSAQANLERLNAALEGAVAAIALTVEKRDPYTAGHQRRVADLACAIAAEMGLPKERIRGIHFGGLIHDIGKIYVPAEILNRPGRLSEFEYGMIKSHPLVGHEIIRGVDFPWPVADMVLQHHERLDGSGYPNGLKGEQIGLEARILSVADVVEAITSHRPYRPGLGKPAGVEEILRGRGTAYDPDVVDACAKVILENGYALND